MLNFSRLLYLKWNVAMLKIKIDFFNNLLFNLNKEINFNKIFYF